LSVISNVSERVAETGQLLERAVGVVFLAAAILVILCIAALVAAGTFGVLHNGNDFGNDFGNGSGRGGDIIVLPAQPF
jgi:hypothetical protein